MSVAHQELALLCSASNSPIRKDSSTEPIHLKRGSVIIHMTCGTVLHAFSFLTLLSRNKFVDVKRGLLLTSSWEDCVIAV